MYSFLLLFLETNQLPIVQNADDASLVVHLHTFSYCNNLKIYICPVHDLTSLRDYSWVSTHISQLLLIYIDTRTLFKDFSVKVR